MIRHQHSCLITGHFLFFLISNRVVNLVSIGTHGPQMKSSKGSNSFLQACILYIIGRYLYIITLILSMSDSVYSTWPSMIQYLPNSALVTLNTSSYPDCIKRKNTHHRTKSDLKVVQNLFCLIHRKFLFSCITL